MRPIVAKLMRANASCIFASLLLLAGCVCPPVAQPAGQDVPSVEASAQRTAPAHRSPFKEPPGVLFNDVTQANIQTTICVAGWTATVRPSTSFTQGLKKLMLTRAGLSPDDAP